MKYIESLDKFFENKTSFRKRLDELYSLFIELRTLGFSEEDYSESFVSHLINKIIGDLQLSGRKKERLPIHVLKYIDYAMQNTVKFELEETQEVEVQEVYEDERDLIPDKQIDWEFMKAIGMEHPDE